MNGSSCALNDLSAKSSLFFFAKLLRWTRHIMMAGNLIVGVPGWWPRNRLYTNKSFMRYTGRSLSKYTIVGWLVGLCRCAFLDWLPATLCLYNNHHPANS
jgi:hypothetical protein